jgi:sugar lactone lactonase YvrE
MQFSKALSIVSALALALGAGCAGGPTAQSTGWNGATPSVDSSAHRTEGWLSPAASSKQLVYISSSTANAVYIYPKDVAPGANPPPIGEITDGIASPSGSFVDRHGDLFVANNANFTVTMYPRGSTQWSLRYTGFAYPNNVTVSRKGTVYIADFTGDKVVEFPKGSTRSKLTIPIGYPPHGVALDAHDNVYVSYNTGAHGEGPGAVNEYAPGSTGGKNLNLPIGWAAGDVIDGSGNLLVCDQSNAAVYVFPPGSTSPSQTITQGLSDPVNLAFDASFKYLYVEDAVVDGVLVYEYPSGTYVTTLNNGATGIDGIALYPEGN